MSIVSYCIAIASAVFALCTRQIVLGCLILFYCQMQLSEALIWRGIDTNNTNLNKTGTNFGKYLLATHNIGIGLGILISIIFISRRDLKWTDFIPLFAGVAFFLIIVFAVYLPQKYPDVTYPLRETCQQKGKRDCDDAENRLKWPYPHDWYAWSFALSLVIMFIWAKPWGSKIAFTIFFSVLFAMSILIYPHTVGSVWCWATSFVAPVMVIANYFIIRNLKNSEILC